MKNNLTSRDRKRKIVHLDYDGELMKFLEGDLYVPGPLCDNGSYFWPDAEHRTKEIHQVTCKLCIKALVKRTNDPIERQLLLDLPLSANALKDYLSEKV